MLFSCPTFARPNGEIGSLSASDVSAQSAILIDAHEGKVLFEKNSRTKMGMASTTKIMTALVVAESCDIGESITVDARAVGVEGSSIYLTAGEKLTVEQLLYALLLASANDAAVALALHVSESVELFAEKMNEKALSLGLKNTHFVNPHGLYDEDHYTTAYDLAIIAKETLKNDTIKKIVSTYKTTIPLCNGEGTRVLVNHNKMLKLYDGAIGVKTGFTKKTGRTLVSAAERDGLRLIAVTLNAPNDWNDHTLMLDYGFENYTRATFFETGEFRYALGICGGKEEYAVLTNSEPIALTVKKEHSKETYTVETCSRFICAPICAKAELGRVVFECDGESVSSPLIAICDITVREEKSFFEKILGASKTWKK
jgi:D-alanyl-D-alanine carboxypeptidase